MKNDNIYGPGNITKALGINIEQDGENLLDGSIALSPRIHPVDRAIAKQRKILNLVINTYGDLHWSYNGIPN